MLILKLALRNVWRNGRRSLLTISGIVAGMLGIIILGGYYEYNYWGLRESLIHSQYGHVQLALPDYSAKQAQQPFDFMLPRSTELVAWLDQQPEVDTCSPHLAFWGVADSGSAKSALVKIVGVIPERENRVNTFFTKKQGQDLYSGDTAAAELGVSLAEKLKLNAGDPLFLSTVAANGAQNALQVTAKSLIGSYSSDFDSRNVRLPLASAQILAGVSGVPEIIIALKSTDDTAAFKSRLQRELPALGWHLEVTSWDEHAGYYGQVVNFYGGYFRIILLIVGLVAFFSTLNTMVMSIHERTGEIGTVRSFGATGRYLLALFLAEGAAIGLIATLGGIILSCGLAGLINALGGIPMPPPPGLTTNVHVHILITPLNLAIAAAIGIVVPLLAALLPTLQSIRCQIIDQIRQNT